MTGPPSSAAPPPSGVRRVEPDFFPPPAVFAPFFPTFFPPFAPLSATALSGTWGSAEEAEVLSLFFPPVANIEIMRIRAPTPAAPAPILTILPDFASLRPGTVDRLGKSSLDSVFGELLRSAYVEVAVSGDERLL